MTSQEAGSSSSGTPFHEKDFLYSVLNLPRSASDNEVRERYRTLSVQFHPDKHVGDPTRHDTATARFLEIQKAYEVLSDPFLRQVYDIYGFEGLSKSWPADLRAKSPEELRKILTYARRDLEVTKIEEALRPRGFVTLGIDARSLFERDAAAGDDTWTEDLERRVREVDLTNFSVRHNIQKRVNEKTRVFVSSRLATMRNGASKAVAGNIVGTVRHSWSPRLDFEGTAALMSPRVVTLKSTYRNDEDALVLETSLSSTRPFPPPLTAIYSRRLFPNSLTEGTLIARTGPTPSVTAALTFTDPFDMTEEADLKGPRNERLGSPSGLGIGMRQSIFGVSLAGLQSAIYTEWSVAFAEIAAKAKVGASLGLLGLSWVLSGVWGNDERGVTTSVAVSASGVELKLDVNYLGQRIVVPIAIGDDPDAVLGLVTAAVPTAAFLLAYQLILQPRRRRQRAEFFRAARSAFADERAEARRKGEETAALLREPAQRHMQAEKAREGLVIMEATYGPMDPDPEARDLMVDVTIPLQALVQHGQLYIPGHRSKAGVQGFCDPVPDCMKALRVRYTFGGRAHYAEIPDYMPVVLPLSDHAVEGGA
ncbi:DnaJ-domain-containing protein [Dentipellis sp. KUC8613]|nr:DnaJ-domain-containing protein [Dentipellis sp. KUC8613]